MHLRSMLTAVAVVALPFALATPASASNAPAAAASSQVPDYIANAMDDPARGDDVDDDTRRQMAAVMQFSGVEPGDTVVEIVPGTGYWTRVFSQIVGDQGHVYTIWPQEMSEYAGDNMAKWKKLAQKSHYANVSVLEQPAQKLKAPEKADLVFTAQNYHDYHNMDVDIHAFDENVRDALKDDGSFVVIDHVAPEGSGSDATDTLHRIDPALVKTEIREAGFKLADTSDALRNPDDPHDIKVFDDSIRGHTDQFIFRFVKD